MCYYCIWWIKAHNEYQPHIAYNKMMYACFFLDPPNDIMNKRLIRAFSLSGHHIHSWQTSVTDLPRPDHEIQLFCDFNDTQSLFYKRQQIKISIGNLPHKFPDSIVGWADVGPTSGRLHVGPTLVQPTLLSKFTSALFSARSSIKFKISNRPIFHQHHPTTPSHIKPGVWIGILDINYEFGVITNMTCRHRDVGYASLWLRITFVAFCNWRFLPASFILTLYKHPIIMNHT